MDAVVFVVVVAVIGAVIAYKKSASFKAKVDAVIKKKAE